MLPLAPGVAERLTHDYIHHGTTSLFAKPVLFCFCSKNFFFENVLLGTVAGILRGRHNSKCQHSRGETNTFDAWSPSRKSSVILFSVLDPPCTSLSAGQT